MRSRIHLPLALSLASIPGALSHYFFPYFIDNGNVTDYYEYVREDTQGYMPWKGNYDSNDLRCNTDSFQYASRTDVYKVNAGDTIGFGTNFGAQIEHPGPMQVYLSKAPGDIHDYDGSGDWFKIWELGPTSFSSDGIEWGVTGRSNFTFPLPKETPPGHYLVRIEHIALHGAGDFGGAEFYFNCAQIEVESDSTAIPEPVVKIPGVYDGYEPGILFYMYRPYWHNYSMPGPLVWPQSIGNSIYAEGVTGTPTGTWSAPAVTPLLTSAGVVSSSVRVTSTPLTSTSLTAGKSRYSFGATTAPVVETRIPAGTMDGVDAQASATDCAAMTVTIRTTITTTTIRPETSTTEDSCAAVTTTTTVTTTVTATDFAAETRPM
ncbi:glycosyl hydrolase family 61-domain-containing protein [Penicillium malachiteum]|uniref:lytic cellulose monooxygenase (C4-dehydrogenating) n=1 Tax=Penicillium malachiteum TaxID=1324776 RepID=A0AAD6MY54_9EURO|nr:glycosyl hydrolase family 61-domain-containing protein [Penicillium malachiteum]